MNIKSILPLLTCLIHGQMRPPLALTSEEKKGMFPRLKVRMEKLLKNPNLDVIDKWYIDTLPNFINLQTEEEISNAASEELLKLLDDKEHSYTPIDIPDTLPIMKIKVNGMMCGHCEAHVKKALEAVDGIETAVASHDENLVTITLSKDVDEALIKSAVTEAGYEYAGII